MRELELARAQEASLRMREQVALFEEQIASRNQDRIARVGAYERALQEALEHRKEGQSQAVEEAVVALQHAKQLQAQAMEEQLHRMDEAHARYEHALQLQEERIAQARVKMEEALAKEIMF